MNDGETAMPFPYEQYEEFEETFRCHYPAGSESQARRIVHALAGASPLLERLLAQPRPAMEVLLVALPDWEQAPRAEDEETIDTLLPYLTAATEPPTLVIPTHLDAIIGDPGPEKLAYLLYHEVTYAVLDQDPRPWPEDYPLWADEWQLQFASLWLARELDGQADLVNADLHAEYPEIFEVEEDGKTPVTIRGFDWDEETTPEDYLAFELLLERFCSDLLRQHGPEVLPRFLTLYRQEHPALLSDDVATMLGTAIGPGGSEWLEAHPCF